MHGGCRMSVTNRQFPQDHDPYRRHLTTSAPSKTELLSGTRFFFFLDFWAPMTLPLSPKSTHFSQKLLSSLEREPQRNLGRNPTVPCRMLGSTGAQTTLILKSCFLEGAGVLVVASLVPFWSHFGTILGPFWTILGGEMI